MPLYTFYPCRVDDASLGFEAYELADDGVAGTRSVEVLKEHLSAEFVVVWCGERKVFTQYRAAFDPQIGSAMSVEASAE